eukprot:jgi/Mesvir1/16229/Mv08483-RA.1
MQKLTDKIIRLNVGGEHMDVLSSTLCKYPSKLSKLADDDFVHLADDVGRIFQDASPAFMRVVLHYLQTSRVLPLASSLELDELAAFMEDLAFVPDVVEAVVTAASQATHALVALPAREFTRVGGPFFFDFLPGSQIRSGGHFAPPQYSHIFNTCWVFQRQAEPSRVSIRFSVYIKGADPYYSVLYLDSDSNDAAPTAPTTLSKTPSGLHAHHLTCKGKESACCGVVDAWLACPTNNAAIGNTQHNPGGERGGAAGVPQRDAPGGMLARMLNPSTDSSSSSSSPDDWELATAIGTSPTGLAPTAALYSINSSSTAASSSMVRTDPSGPSASADARVPGSGPASSHVKAVASASASTQASLGFPIPGGPGSLDVTKTFCSRSTQTWVGSPCPMCASPGGHGPEQPPSYIKPRFKPEQLIYSDMLADPEGKLQAVFKEPKVTIDRMEEMASLMCRPDVESAVCRVLQLYFPPRRAEQPQQLVLAKVRDAGVQCSRYARAE